MLFYKTAPCLLKYEIRMKRYHHHPKYLMHKKFEIFQVAYASSELLHELLVELGDSANPLSARSEESGSEMQSALLLSKATSCNDTDTGCIEQSQAVVLIWLSTFLLGLLDSLGRESNGGEEVHGAGGRLAGHSFHLAESLVEGGGTLLEAVEDTALFSMVGLVGRVSFDRWLDHKRD